MSVMIGDIDGTLAVTTADCPEFPLIKGEDIRHCPGYVGYAATTGGKILSCWMWGIRRKRGDRRLSATWRECHGWIDQGYRRVQLRATKNSCKTIRRVHQLILEAFVGPRPKGYETRHLDGDPVNNHLANLCYGTHSENQQDSIRHGTHTSIPWRSLGPPNQKLTDDDVRMIRKLGKCLAPREIAALYAIHYHTAWAIVRRKYRRNVM